MFDICKREGVRLAAVLVVLGLMVMGGCPGPDDNGTPDGDDNGVTPPTPKSGLGPVAFLTADDTTLSVGETTTARLWVQQSSPNAENDNGIFSVAVNVEASQPGVVQSQVPVSLLPGWDTPAVPARTGTATVSGGISEIATGVDILVNDRSQGTSGPVQVFTFTVQATGPGTVTLTPTNYTSGGFKGVLDYDGQMGDQGNYEPVQITVQ